MSSTAATDSASPWAASGPASTATPASPMIRPVQRTSVSRSDPPVNRASTAPMIGTAATSRPLVELARCFSALESNANGPMISTTANATSQRQWPRSAPSSRRRSATGSSSREPSATRTNTSTGTETPPSATLISRYGIPQMRLIAANSTQPRRLTAALLSDALAARWANPAGGQSLRPVRNGAKAHYRPRQAWTTSTVMQVPPPELGAARGAR